VKFSADAFAALVEKALAEIPEFLQGHMADVVVDIEPMPDRATSEKAGVDDPRELLGVYHGTPLTERSVEQARQLPDRVTIYQRNIERCCRNRREAVEQIRRTVLHEVGHHFGLDEDDLEEMGYG